MRTTELPAQGIGGSCAATISIRPLTSRCRAAFDARAHASLGFSPCNSYYSRERIQRILSWGLETFSTISVIVHDVPLAWTFEAAGYDRRRAEQKAHKENRRLRNKITSALDNLGAREPPPVILDWETLSRNTVYLRRLEEVMHAFETDETFRSACLECTRAVIASKSPATAVDDLSHERLLLGARYLLTELPYFLDFAGIVGQPASVFCYHSTPPLFEHLVTGRYPVRPSGHQGYVELHVNLDHPVTEGLSEVHCRAA